MSAAGLELDLLLDAIADRVAERLRSVSTPPAVQPWRLLNLEDAAARLGRSTRWVRERAKRGELPFVRLDGGALAFEEDDLRSFAAARRVGDESSESLAVRLQAGRDPASRKGSRARDVVVNRRVSP